MNKLRIALTALAFGAMTIAGAAHAAVGVLAAENFYGDIARQVGGEHVHVHSILGNTGGHPHLFEVSPSQARLVADADVVIYNGLGFDVWMERLLAASRDPGRTVIEVAGLVGAEPGSNPHIWYDPATMAALAERLSALLAEIDPTNAKAYRAGLAAFRADMRPLRELMTSIRERFEDTAVTATEPVFGPMAEALGLEMKHLDFQLAIMNETAPSASQIIAFQESLEDGTVAALIYNKQVAGAMPERLLQVAREAGVPVVGVTGTAPVDTGYQAWMSAQLQALLDALEHR